MLSCVALAWHLAGSSTPFGVTIATMLPCIKAFKLILSIFPAPFFLDILIPTLVCTPHPFLHPLLPMFCSHPPQVYSSLSGLVLLQGLSWPSSGLVSPSSGLVSPAGSSLPNKNQCTNRRSLYTFGRQSIFYPCGRGNSAISDA